MKERMKYYGIIEIVRYSNCRNRICIKIGFDFDYYDCRYCDCTCCRYGSCFLETLGSSFVANRSMCVFVMVMVVTGTLERNGLKQAAANLMKKFKNASAGVVLAIYGVFRLVFAAFNVSFGGVAGFVRPIVLPMATAAAKKNGKKISEKYEENLKGMASRMENIAWFFGQVLFVGTSGMILVQSTLAGLGYNVELVDLMKVQIPVAIIAVAVAIVYYYLKDKQLSRKETK